MIDRVCPKCGSSMYLEETYEKDRQVGWVWVCPNEDYEEEDDEDNYFDLDYEREAEKNLL